MGNNNNLIQRMEGFTFKNKQNYILSVLVTLFLLFTMIIGYYLKYKDLFGSILLFSIVIVCVYLLTDEYNNSFIKIFIWKRNKV